MYPFPEIGGGGGSRDGDWERALLTHWFYGSGGGGLTSSRAIGDLARLVTSRTPHNFLTSRGVVRPRVVY